MWGRARKPPQRTGDASSAWHKAKLVSIRRPKLTNVRRTPVWGKGECLREQCDGVAEQIEGADRQPPLRLVRSIRCNPSARPIVSLSSSNEHSMELKGALDVEQRPRAPLAWPTRWDGGRDRARRHG